MFFESDTRAVQALASQGICFPHLPAAASQVQVISEFLRDPFEQNCDFDVIIDIDQPSTRLFAHTNQVQPPNKAVTEISSLKRMILRRALQQTNFSRRRVRSVLVVLESPHFEFVLFLWVVSDASQSLATHQSTQSSCHTSCHDFLSRFQRCKHSLSSRVRRLFQEPFSVTRQS